MSKFNDLQKTHWKYVVNNAIYFAEIQLEKNKMLIIYPNGSKVDCELFGESNEIILNNSRIIKKNGDTYDYVDRKVCRGKYTDRIIEENACYKYIEYLISEYIGHSIIMNFNRKLLIEKCERAVKNGMNDGFIIPVDVLSELSVKRLRLLCKRRKIRKYIGASADELIDKILEDQCSDKYAWRIKMMQQKKKAEQVLTNIQKEFGCTVKDGDIMSLEYSEVPYCEDEKYDFLRSYIFLYLMDDFNLELRCEIGNPKNLWLVIHIDENDGYTADAKEDDIINTFKNVKSTVEKLKVKYDIEVEVRTPWW